MATLRRVGAAGRPVWMDFADTTWRALASGAADVATPLFDPATLNGLPEPAQRYLARALPAGVALSSLVELEMESEIKLGRRWLRFTAQQILRAGGGLVWAPVVGGRVVRFVGADVLGSDQPRIEFRFHGRFPGRPWHWRRHSAQRSGPLGGRNGGVAASGARSAGRRTVGRNRR